MGAGVFAACGCEQSRKGRHGAALPRPLAGESGWDRGEPPVSLVPGPTPRHDVANGSRKGPLCKSPGHRQWRRGLSQLRRARAGLGSGDKTDRRAGPRPLAPGAIWPSCSWLSSAQPCVAQSLAPAPFSARRGEGGVTPGRAPPTPPLGGSPCSVCVVNAGTGRRPPFRPRGQSSRFVAGGHCGAGRGFLEACVVSRSSFSSC